MVTLLSKNYLIASRTQKQIWIDQKEIVKILCLAIFVVVFDYVRHG
jgi:hypothetical protein